VSMTNSTDRVEIQVKKSDHRHCLLLRARRERPRRRGAEKRDEFAAFIRVTDRRPFVRYVTNATGEQDVLAN